MILKNLQRQGNKTITEIQTFPYDKEYKNLKLYQHIEHTTDKLFRYQFAKYNDRIVTFSNDMYIFNCPTINISNGINLSRIPLKSNKPLNKNEIHLMAVAEIHYWHGFDRLVEGLGIYYQNNPSTKVYFHIIGGMSDYERYGSTH